MPQSLDNVTCSLGPAEADPGAPRRRYLMVFEGESAAMVPLPPAGEFLIGRAPEVHLRLRDPAVSRVHLRLLLSEAGAEVVDMGRHGARRNGQPLCGTEPLSAGDILSLCGVHLVYHQEAPAPRRRTLSDLPTLRQRAEEELERCRVYGRQLALLCADLGAAADRARAALLLHDGLRVLDAAAFADDTHLMVLLPELRPSEVPAAAARVLGALRPLYHNSAAPRAAWATCPGDGADLDTAGPR